MELSSDYTKLVGCRVPVQQAPMGSVSTPALAVAVAEAGGVGSITALGMPVEFLERVLDQVANETSGAVAVNFLTEDLDREALALAASRVRLIDFFWVDPSRDLVDAAHGGGALVSWQVGSVHEARAAAEVGADIIVAQGVEAGGHVRGHTPLLPLLSAVLDVVEVPVVAAGGIADGRALAAVLAAGASGARLGTRFVATTESGAHDLYRSAVVAAGSDSTEITDAFAVCPLCATSPRARVLRRCIDAVGQLGDEPAGEATLGGSPFTIEKGSGLPPGATATGNIDAMAMYAGAAVEVINSISPAALVISDIIESATALLDRSPHA